MTFDERIAKIEEYVPDGYVPGIHLGRSLSDKGTGWYISFGLMHRPAYCILYCDTVEDCLTQLENWLARYMERK
jgi:hypothetical protein